MVKRGRPISWVTCTIPYHITTFLVIHFRMFHFQSLSTARELTDSEILLHRAIVPQHNPRRQALRSLILACIAGSSAMSPNPARQLREHRSLWLVARSAGVAIRRKKQKSLRVRRAAAGGSLIGRWQWWQWQAQSKFGKTATLPRLPNIRWSSSCWLRGSYRYHGVRIRTLSIANRALQRKYTHLMVLTCL